MKGKQNNMDISTITFLLIILTMAGLIGYFVVWGVTPALHTPLMAVTNAISGIVVIAAIMVAGAGEISPELARLIPVEGSADQMFYARILGFVGVTLASINIFGGFTITNRMLEMFRKKDK